MSANEIAEKANHNFPFLQTSADSVRGVVNSRKNIFMTHGRDSVYGLKKWENTNKNIKGGSIRNIAYEYLRNEKEPRHISDITEHLLKYRPKTYQRSILENINSDDEKKFIFFENRYVGIINKEYSNKYIVHNYKVRTWDEKHQDLKTFIEINKRMPKQKSNNKVEIQSCSFRTHIMKQYRKGILTEEKEKKLRDIGFKFE